MPRGCIAPMVHSSGSSRRSRPRTGGVQGADACSRRFRPFPLSLTFHLPAMKRFLLCVLIATIALAGVQPGSEGQGPAIRSPRATPTSRNTSSRKRFSNIATRSPRSRRAPTSTTSSRAAYMETGDPVKGLRVLLTGGGPRSVESRRAVAVGRAAADGRPSTMKRAPVRSSR